MFRKALQWKRNLFSSFSHMASSTGEPTGVSQFAAPISLAAWQAHRAPNQRPYNSSICGHCKLAMCKGLHKSSGEFLSGRLRPVSSRKGIHLARQSLPD